MNRKVIGSLFLAVVSFGTIAFAHDASLHKGKPVVGRIAQLSENGFTVESSSGDTTVQLTKDTSIAIGQEGQQGTVTDLKQGSDVMVFGTKLESGVLVATEVMLHAERSESAEEDRHSESHGF